jgi:hypothetical protein
MMGAMHDHMQMMSGMYPHSQLPHHHQQHQQQQQQQHQQQASAPAGRRPVASTVTVEQVDDDAPVGIVHEPISAQEAAAARSVPSQYPHQNQLMPAMSDPFSMFGGNPFAGFPGFGAGGGLGGSGGFVTSSSSSYSSSMGGGQPVVFSSSTSSRTVNGVCLSYVPE